MSKNYKFTNYWAIGGVSGEFCQPPEVGAEEVAIPYYDMGYMGGVYWAIVPKNWNKKDAFLAHDSQNHLTTLSDIGWHLVPEENRPV